MAKLTESYNLKTINPKLVKEWHPTKNGNLTPKDITPSCNKKVWWVCENNHEWPSTIFNRSRGSGCPYCAGQSLCHDNCLQTKNPKLSKEWHPTKNGNLTPKDITSFKNKKVWWRCAKGHEWPALVSSRSVGAGCPFCAGLFASEENNLQILNPILSKQWHPVKNGNLTPKHVLPYSCKKVWWRCAKGHEWVAAIKARTKGNGCPGCSGRTATKENNLQVANPKLAKEWHPTKNGDLTPKDILPGSHKKRWWKCANGHEWQTFVYSRNQGSGCRYCNRQKRLSA